MVCTVTATAKSKAYRLVTTYVTDPNRASVVLHTDYQPLTSAAHGYQLYVRLDASAVAPGGGIEPDVELVAMCGRGERLVVGVQHDGGPVRVGHIGGHQPVRLRLGGRSDRADHAGFIGGDRVGGVEGLKG